MINLGLLRLQSLIESTTVSMSFRLHKYKQYERSIKSFPFLIGTVNGSEIFLLGT